MSLTNNRLDDLALNLAQSIHRKSLDLVEHLLEIDQRKSFAVHGYSSLFTYIVNYLGFSDAQAAVYNSVVKSQVTKESGVKKMMEKGEVSLSVLGLVGQHIKNHKSDYEKKGAKEELVRKFAGKKIGEVKKELNSIRNDENTSVSEVNIEVSAKLYGELQKVKKKIGLSEMSDSDCISYLTNKELMEGIEMKINKTITLKTKRVLLRRSGHRCEFVSSLGRRCECTSKLEVDHIIPKAKGGTNNPDNLRIYCRSHNLLAAINEFGVLDKYFYRQ